MTLVFWQHWGQVGMSDKIAGIIKDSGKPFRELTSWKEFADRLKVSVKTAQPLIPIGAF